MPTAIMKHDCTGVVSNMVGSNEITRGLIKIIKRINIMGSKQNKSQNVYLRIIRYKKTTSE